MSGDRSGLDSEGGITRHEANKKLQADMDHLASAKDRAQISSASAMSILDVGVLGDVIRRGSTYSMYVPLLLMVSLALLLQVIVGILSLKISNMKNYYRRFGTTNKCCEQFRTCLCFQKREDKTENVQQVICRAQMVSPLPKFSFQAGLVEDSGEPCANLGMSSYPNEMQSYDGTEEVSILHRIYGMPAEAPPSEPDFSHVPAPYEKGRNGDSGEQRPGTVEDQTVDRLGAWVEKMLETKERQVETRANLLFLEKEEPQCNSRLEELHRAQEELSKVEQSLSEEMDALGNTMDKALAYVQQYDTERLLCGSKAKELAELEKDSSPDGGVINNKAKIQQEIKGSQERLEICGAEKRAYSRAEQRLASAEKKMMQVRKEMERTARDVRETEDYLRGVQEERDRQLKRRRLLEIDEGKFKLYRAMVSDLEKQNVLKRVMFWQSILNYILYTVFILNLFITTFSLMSEEA